MTGTAHTMATDPAPLDASSVYDATTTTKYPSSSSLLSPELTQFYEKHNVSGVVQDYLANNHTTGTDTPYMAHRFVRLNPRFLKSETLAMLQNEVAVLVRSEAETTHGGSLNQVTMVPWLDEIFGFYALPGSFQLSQSNVFRSGRIYGMDVSSGAAVAALLSTRYHDDDDAKPCMSQTTRTTTATTDGPIRILDLCCCPGLKLCMMADLWMASSSVLVGVDISESRMALCQRIVSKYHIHPDTSGRVEAQDKPTDRMTRIRLYQTEGTTFGRVLEEETKRLVFDSHVAVEQVVHAGKRKRLNKSARARKRRRLQEVATYDVATNKQNEEDAHDSNSWIQLFDYVLVDAECSTDGSLKHVHQRLVKQRLSKTLGSGVSNQPAAGIANNPTLADSTKLAELVDLQKRLLASGFRCLKPGGSLVYSTCSLSDEQNEGVVRWFLETNSQKAQLVPLRFPRLHGGSCHGSLGGTVRFLPNLSDTTTFIGGGFFIAKIVKTTD